MSVRQPESEVHVQWTTLSVTDEELGRLEPLLAPDERRRAARYRIPAVRRRFIVGRAILRTLLARYLGADVTDVELEYGEAGKPRLAARLGSDSLRFNLSHSHGLAAFAFCRNTEIGVDIEHVDEAIDTSAIVAAVFSASEQDRYQAIPDTEKRRSFYCAWTRKEAYLKGQGCGLMGSLAEVDVTAASGRRRFAVGGSSGTREWSIEDLVFADGWVGAVAVQREEWRLKDQPGVRICLTTHRPTV